jgi:TonB family protein
MNLLNTDMQNNDLQMEETQKQLAELNQQILTYQSRIQATPHLEQQYAALMRDDALAKQNYQEIVERLEAIQAAVRLEAQSTGARSVVRSAGPTLISRREPEYTDAARKARIQGTVELSVTIGTDGVPRDMRVIRGLNAGLDQKAMDCVTGWRFRPASRGGEAITAFATVEVKFSLPVK